MSDLALSVEALGKRYRLGRRSPHATLREAIATAGSHLLERARRNGGPRPAEEEFWALRDVSFSVGRGDVLGVVGPNGAGKTTLLKILTRIVEPTAGRATIRGRVASLLEVGTGFHPELTGRENVYLNGAILGMPRQEIAAKFDDIVEFAGVERFLETPVKHYSSGMYMRLAFAVAAHLDPDILLVDEVLAVGDAEFQKKCLGKMGSISRAGRTVVFVSHNMFSLQNLCTRGVLLDNGRKTLDDAIGPVIARYLASVHDQPGEVTWESPAAAPGDDRVRLKGVRVVCDGQVSGIVPIDREVRIEVEYWNLEPGSRRVVGVNVYTATGICAVSSCNVPSASRAPDPWFDRAYPRGLFRTVCTIPGRLLNDGVHTVTLAIHGQAVGDHRVWMEHAISFTVRDTPRDDYTGHFISAVRPLLGWETEQLA